MVPAMAERFTMEVTAQAADIDEVEHVSNLVYVRWIQDVAVAHSAAVGWSFQRYREFGAIFVVRRHELDYITPVMLGQVVRLETWIDSWRAASCVRRTELYRAHDNVVVARGATTWAFMRFAEGRPQRIPEEILRQMGPAATPSP